MPASENPPMGLMISSIVCSIIAIGFLPPVWGGVAIYLGYQAYQRNTNVGQICMVFGGLALIIGVIVGAWEAMGNL